MSKKEEIGTLSEVRGLPTINHFQSQTSQGSITQIVQNSLNLLDLESPSQSSGPTPPFYRSRAQTPKQFTDTPSGRSRTIELTCLMLILIHCAMLPE